MPDHFRGNFPSKIDEKINAKIDTQKVMKFDEKWMRKWTYFLVFFKTCVHVKPTFFENGEIVYTLAGCSRMRVGEDLHKNRKIKKMRKILNKSTPKKVSKKRCKKYEKTFKK